MPVKHLPSSESSSSVALSNLHLLSSPGKKKTNTVVIDSLRINGGKDIDQMKGFPLKNMGQGLSCLLGHRSPSTRSIAFCARSSSREVGSLFLQSILVGEPNLPPKRHGKRALLGDLVVEWRSQVCFQEVPSDSVVTSHVDSVGRSESLSLVGSMDKPTKMQSENETRSNPSAMKMFGGVCVRVSVCVCAARPRRDTRQSEDPQHAHTHDDVFLQHGAQDQVHVAKGDDEHLSSWQTNTWSLHDPLKMGQRPHYFG